MSGNLIDLRRRINSVKNTQKVTRAMKTISAAKLRRNVSDLNRNRPFIDKIKYLLSKLKNEVKVEAAPFLKKRDEGDTILVVLSSDKGLCGSFNSNIITKTVDYYGKLKENEEKIILVTVGNKIFKYFSKRDYHIKKDYGSMMSKLTFKDAFELSKYLQDIYLNESIIKIEFLYSEFISASKQEITIKQLFPIEVDWKESEDDAVEEKAEIEYIFEPSTTEIFHTLLPKYINSLVYRILLESAASEHSARMIAMDMATRNSDDMIRILTITLNKMRQALITKELLEIITATEALKE